MSDQEIEELRALILSERGDKKGPFPKGLRERLNGFLKAKWQQGASLKRVAGQLGLSDHTVQYWRTRWGERGKADAKLRRVEVVSEKPGKLAKTVTIHGPAGTRVEGLSLDEVASLWSKLG